MFEIENEEYDIFDNERNRKMYGLDVLTHWGPMTHICICNVSFDRVR